MKIRLLSLVLLLLILSFPAGCAAPAATPTVAPPTATLAPAPTATPTVVSGAAGLSSEEIAALGSLAQVDDYPLYTMRHQGAYRWVSPPEASLEQSPAWACSLFAALGDPDHRLYGRNFDWDYSPALLLFTDPPDGYASVSMVDIAYLRFGANVKSLTSLPLDERVPLLNAPFIPFDGMNERGLAVGMAAVSPGNVRPDPHKETVDSLRVIRLMLDQASTVDEAVAILKRYNVDMEGGPPVHYLIADRSGRAALVEFYRGEVVVMPNNQPWHRATNFLRASVETAAGQCWRYDKLDQRLTETGGRLTASSAMELLGAVSQGGTQWSVVYEISTGEVHMVMGRRYAQAHTFHLGQ